MAIVKFGPTVVGARGTIGGIIFTANKGGPYIRTWARGSNPRSELQTALRGAFGTRASAWRDLSQAERDDWIDYADDPAQELINSLGETYFASGFNWYVRINLHLEAAGEANRVLAPTLTRPLAPIITSGILRTTGAPGFTVIGFTAASPGLAGNHVVTARIVNSQGILPIPAKKPLIIIDVPVPLRTIELQPQISDIFGTISLGQRWLMSVQTQDAHGQRGPEDTNVTDATS